MKNLVFTLILSIFALTATAQFCIGCTSDELSQDLTSKGLEYDTIYTDNGEPVFISVYPEFCTEAWIIIYGQVTQYLLVADSEAIFQRFVAKFDSMIKPHYYGYNWEVNNVCIAGFNTKKMCYFNAYRCKQPYGNN